MGRPRKWCWTCRTRHLLTTPHDKEIDAAVHAWDLNKKGIRMKKMTADKGKGRKMTAVEAGRKGGKAMKDTHDHDWYVRIGKKGGAIVRDAFAALKREQEGKGKKGRGR